MGGVRPLPLALLPFKVLWEGVLGVGGKESEALVVADDRFSARWTGRKMPEPGIEVVK